MACAVQWCSEQSWATDAKLLKQGIITSNILNVVARYNISISQLTMDLFHLMFTGLDCIYIYKYTTAGDYPIRSSNWLPFESTYVHPRIWWCSLENICSPPYLMGFMRAHMICSPPYLMGFMLMNLHGFLYCVMLGIFILFVFVFYAQCCQNL